MPTKEPEIRFHVGVREYREFAAVARKEQRTMASLARWIIKRWLEGHQPKEQRENVKEE